MRSLAILAHRQASMAEHLVSLRLATIDDADLLARMNRCLIEDEGSRNPMSEDQLAQRMRVWLAGEWRAVLVLVDSAPAGYLLFCQRSDEYDPAQQEIYVRQFYVDRRRRGQGIGARAFAEIAEQYFPADARLVLDVLAQNEAGRRFWETLGFTLYSQTLQLREARSVFRVRK